MLDHLHLHRAVLRLHRVVLHRLRPYRRRPTLILLPQSPQHRISLLPGPLDPLQVHLGLLILLEVAAVVDILKLKESIGKSIVSTHTKLMSSSSHVVALIPTSVHGFLCDQKLAVRLTTQSAT